MNESAHQFNYISKETTEIKGLSYQQIFDHIVGHAMKQGKRCSAGDTCLYRLDRTAKCETMCFVGCLIPDEIYKVEMEGNDVHSLLNHSIEVLECICGNIHIFDKSEDCKITTFLTDLQVIHDRTHPMLWMVKLIAFAKKHDLELPVEIANNLN